MRYWWVNQNQTFRQEIEGGYLWSPKRNKNGHRNPFYEFMREVAPGDIVLSFCDTRIAALGIVSGYCRESPKPEEFGTRRHQLEPDRLAGGRSLAASFQCSPSQGSHCATAFSAG